MVRKNETRDKWTQNTSTKFESRTDYDNRESRTVLNDNESEPKQTNKRIGFAFYVKFIDRIDGCTCSNVWIETVIQISHNIKEFVNNDKI